MLAVRGCAGCVVSLTFVSSYVVSCWLVSFVCAVVPVFMARYDIARADGEVEIGVNHSVASTANFSTLQPTARTITAVSNTYDVLRDQKTPTRTLRVGLLDFMMVGVVRNAFTHHSHVTHHSLAGACKPHATQLCV